ncbi:PREDICTED: uncharacterized protein LOC106787171 [Polistes canadensis]|uniref:uncharacterized protein LOC106787171 n=1 Tax=Polistes canadensis TaxID=91411 RepID=UPI000718C047|nr:PREDICTED: uncharacterized protein LOC106787171 [Polistes canadensis]
MCFRKRTIMKEELKINSIEVNKMNISYINDNEYSVQLIRWLLTSMGAWRSLKKQNFLQKLRSMIIIVMSYFLICFTLIPCTLYAIIEEDNLQIKMKALGQVSYWLMSTIKYSYILYHRGNVQRCLDHIENDWRIITRSKDRNIMLTHANKARYFILICTSFTYGGVLIYSLVRGMTLIPVIIENRTIYLHPLPCPCYSKLADTRFHPTYEIIYTLQLLSAIITSSIVVCACSLAAVFVMHACGQLTITMAWIEDTFVDSIRSSNYPLTDIVRLHVRTLSFIDYIENVINRICLVELLGCTMNMCLLGYFCITVCRNFDVILFTRDSVMSILFYIVSLKLSS